MVYALSLLAGLLTALSPCVLPVLPLIVGSTGQEHKHAPLAIAAGMILSFTILGVFLATIGTTLGIDPNLIRYLAAGFIVFFGLIMLSSKLQNLLQNTLTPFSNLANSRLSSGKFKGLYGQFNLGILLGAVWSPCVGPTLGAAVGLATQRQSLFQATAMMLLFGIGSAIPLLFIAYGSRKIFLKNRERLITFGQYAKPTMGIVLITVGISILFGIDKLAEAKLLDILPERWIDLISRY
jgi:cytochrome c-type biogenesis protein